MRKALKEQCFYNDNPPPAFGDYGCMDSDAINFDPSATHPCNNIGPNNTECGDCYGNQDWCGPGTYPGDCCEYPDSILGCTDTEALNYDGNATENDGSCVEAVPGCTDQLANNFNPNATIDDGECLYEEEDPCVDYDAIPENSQDTMCGWWEDNSDNTTHASYNLISTLTNNGECCPEIEIEDEEIPVCPDDTINNPNNPACEVGMELEWFDTVNSEILQGINPNFANNWGQYYINQCCVEPENEEPTGCETNPQIGCWVCKDPVRFPDCQQISNEIQLTMVIEYISQGLLSGTYDTSEQCKLIGCKKDTLHPVKPGRISKKTSGNIDKMRKLMR